MNEALDDILADSDDEEEEQAIVNQVLDEIGIEITNKVIIFGTRLHIDIRVHGNSSNISY